MHRSSPTPQLVTDVLLGIVLVVFFVARLQPDRAEPTAEMPVSVEDGASKNAGIAHEIERDSSQEAMHDMYAHALRFLGVFEDDPASIGETDQWSSQWRLHWMDVKQDDRVIRIYHASDRRHPQRRYTATWDGNRTEWKRVD